MSEKYRVQPTFAPETIWVTISPNPNGPPTVHPDVVVLSKGMNEETAWACAEDVDFKVDFEDDSPFYAKHFDRANPHSGRIRPEIPPDPNKKYKYNVRVRDQRLHPDVIIVR